jgi:WD40 repeat protein
MFNIDQNNPASLKMVGGPVSSGGEFPAAVAFSTAKNMVCVVNGGATNGVQCFNPDEQLGLIAIPNTNRSLGLPQTTPATGPPGSVSDILFSEDSKKLLVSVKGVPPTPGFVASWDVAEDGSLSANFTANPPAQGGLLPFSMSIIPGKNAVLATDAGIGFSTFDLSTLGAGATAKSQVFPIAGQGATCWSSFSQKTGSFFLTDIRTDIVTEVAVADDLSGNVIKQYPLTPGSATIDNAIAALPNNDFLYVLSANATSIDVLALNGQSQAAKLQTLNFGDQSGVEVSPNRLQGMAVFVKSAVKSGKVRRVGRERD